mmetsp:Transcript_16842/g.36372  ORF Transcript_16842/g.36372 Transcript_16842/m.36372 type:complete len:1185 (+) Transcript_16842:163-3717(+)|eukprot:CAMPEP_0172304380 /NCGR_PEP_ID=MMETSP1058-20130122/5795_1 /TAXON_ID=83371 /ORGANISM="Detonula confervacea, Strain CCMP 353" /LENGTH=1184 /DNA_ID=CAMNT_0013015597 /DNA_START=115 /DNA_END=3669 /DNA_ORIENTATION=+
MADDDINYNDISTSPTAAPETDDFYSLGNSTDDYWRFKDNYNTNTHDDDDDRYYSTMGTTSWLDKLLSNTTASNEGQLTPVEDVNPDNVLATLIFNSIVCVILLGLYELLRRWIPSVYSQRLMDTPGMTGGGVESQFARISSMKASGKSLQQLNVEEEESTLSNTCNTINDEVCNNDVASQQQEVPSYSFNICSRTCSFPVLEWCIPVHNTPWSTFRHLAGLDAYFFLRYIRMCLKITAVSSFWAIVILCPVYATGGGDQIGFYHFSMANVLQDDIGRVWVPTFFCWAFTMYCWFCVRMEMMHYLDLRMEFLGGEEEERILGRTGGGYGAPKENGKVNTVTEEEDSRSRSPLLAAAAIGGDEGTDKTTALKNQQLDTSAAQVQRQMNQHRHSLQVEKVPIALRSNTALFHYFDDMFPNQVHSACITMNVPDLDALSARRMRVCRRLEKSLAYYSVTGIRPTHIAGRPRCQCCGIESTPVDGLCLAFCCFYDSYQMRTYLDENDLDYPTEVYGSLPDKGECVDSILYYTCDLAIGNRRMKKLQEEKFLIAETGNSPRHSMSKGDRDGVDESNCDWYAQPLGMLKTSAAMAAEGLRSEFEVSGEDDYLGDGVTRSVGYGSVSCPHNVSSGRSTTLSSVSRQQGSTSDKKASLMGEDHLTDSDGHPYREDTVVADPGAPIINGEDGEDYDASIGEIPSSSRRKNIYRSRPYVWFRALLWRMGVDFLAAGLDEVRSRTDVVVDSVTRPSMSSTGFVTFKTLTPVTVATCAPLTYNRNPMEVSIAPEPRDLVWQNAQIDRDIGASRAFVANVLLGVGVLLWSIPLALIQAWAKVENVALIPGFEWVAEIHGGTWSPLINGYLPVITLLGLILILPLIFQWVATSYEKRKTLSGVQNSIVGRYFYYQLANIYITVTAGALWTSLAAIIDHPQQLLVILGETMPKLAGYFISLLLTKTLAGLPMVLLRFGALSRMMFLKSCFNKKRLTQRELNEVYRKQPIYYGWEYPTQFLVIIICFTYACITPFVLPVGALYFFMALLVYKKQSLYVFTPTYESGGRMFPQAVSKTLFALLISQLTFIGYTLIRKGVFQIILLAPLPFLTVFFTIHIQHRYVEPSKKLSLERAVKIDALSDHSPEFSDEAYQQPVLTEKASSPMFETNDDDNVLTEVIRQIHHDLDRLQEETSQSPGVV